MTATFSGSVRLDGLAFEPQFFDHIAPVWRSLSDHLRGTLYVPEALAGRHPDVAVEAIDPQALRLSSPPPTAQPGDGPVAFAASIGDIKVGRRMGYRKFVFMEHGAGQAYIGEKDPFSARHPSYSGGIDREDVGLFLVPNEYSGMLWRNHYSAPVAVVGSPRLDDLPVRQSDGDSLVVAISFHWPGFSSSEADTALGHYIGVLPELAKRFDILGHAHPKGDWPARMERIYRRAGIPFVKDFNDVCRMADVYVCDNSTTLFEFASTNRPVVVLNSPNYRKNVHHGLRFWDAADVGVQVDQPGDLVEAIQKAFFDEPPLPANREKALDVVYAYRHGAAKRAADAIEGWLGEARLADEDQPAAVR